MRSAISALLLATSLVALGACAARPAPGDQIAQEEYNEANDPLEPANRFFYRVNDGLDTYVLRPVAVAYRDVVPGVVRRPIHNVLANISSPVVFTNDVLQAKSQRAGTTMRSRTGGVGDWSGGGLRRRPRAAGRACAARRSAGGQHRRTGR